MKRCFGALFRISSVAWLFSLGKDDVADRLPKDTVLSLYRGMVQIREFELKARDIFRSGQMPGFIHIYVGEEAVAVGICARLRVNDYVTSTHRGHGHALAKGISARSVMAELMGAADGCSGGRGGTMHLYDPGVGFLGSNGVVPPGILIGAGAALGAKLRGSDQVAVAFFGDGAVSNGAFHEGLNLAATWNLPVLFVCENNLYATETPFAHVTKNTDVASRAAAYKMPGIRVDGNDVLDVYTKAGEAVERARRGEGPTLLECLTYRWFGHHEGDPGTAYRASEEVAAWRKNDAVAKLRERAIAESWATAAEFDAVDSEIRKVIEDAAAHGIKSPQPSTSTALEHVFSN
jgi:TPP-dependent pyruvate/acetoin dehydrogenase alpha subunit